MSGWIRESGFGEYSGPQGLKDAPANELPKDLATRLGENKATTAAWLKSSSNDRFLTTLSDTFADNVLVKKGALDAAFAAVTADASDPTALAKYQAALGEYTLYRNAQSNAVKAYKDVDANTIRNFN